MAEVLRVLQVVTKMDRGGLETFIMNMYRNIDRSRVQFDFLYHRDGGFSYDDEIGAPGWTHIPRPAKQSARPVLPQGSRFVLRGAPLPCGALPHRLYERPTASSRQKARGCYANRAFA